MSISLYTGYSCNLGCDPELFVTRLAGKVRKRQAAVCSWDVVPHTHTGQVTRDGVQVELHAGGNTGCRQSISGAISTAFKELHQLMLPLTAKDPTVRISFDPMVTLTPGDLKRLDPNARELNCKPSLNAYGREPIQRDGDTYPYRTASGHLHLGSRLFTEHLVDPVEAVKIYALAVGIPCVLVDQDPSQKIRRETYGRAGEYRLPVHGLEYRVPSNFWLKDYRLMALVFGLAKTATRVIDGLRKEADVTCRRAKDTLLNKVDFVEVERVINENDFDGALRIWTENIRPLSNLITPYYGIGEGLTSPFEYFIETVHEKGLGHWFNLDEKAILHSWTNLSVAVGWERFLMGEVSLKMNAAKFTGIILDSTKALKAPKTTVPVAEYEPSLRIAA